MAELTDLTITPMLPIGIGVTIFILGHTMGWSFPVAAVTGIVIGPVLGFCFGLLLTGVINILVEIVCKIYDRRAEKKPRFKVNSTDRDA